MRLILIALALATKSAWHHPIVFAGTKAAVELARDRIINLLKQRGRFKTSYFDMEPFEVLRDIIRENLFDDIGGPPQLAKIYQNGSTQVFAVRWKMPHWQRHYGTRSAAFPKCDESVAGNRPRSNQFCSREDN